MIPETARLDASTRTFKSASLALRLSASVIVALDPIQFVFDASESDHLRYSRLNVSGERRTSRFPFDKFVQFYPFTEINRAVEDQRDGIAIKPILDVAAA